MLGWLRSGVLMVHGASLRACMSAPCHASDLHTLACHPLPQQMGLPLGGPFAVIDHAHVGHMDTSLRSLVAGH